LSSTDEQTFETKAGEKIAVRQIIATLAMTGAALVLASGLALGATWVGGPSSDILEGTDRPDRLDGQGGNDIIYGRGGNDRVAAGGLLIGGGGDDVIYGGSGSDDLLGGRDLSQGEKKGEKGRDTLHGHAGSDRMFPDAGSDVLYGGAGSDEIADGENRGGSRDTLYGSGGNDFFFPRNEPAVRDMIYCGKGTDVVYADRKDFLHNCEVVHFRNPRPGEV
jgi:Ca2+-binding RTX toxin-like protein